MANPNRMPGPGDAATWGPVAGGNDPRRDEARRRAKQSLTPAQRRHRKALGLD